MKGNNIAILPIIFLVVIFGFYRCNDDSPEEILKRKMLIEINRMRMSGCNCGTDTIPPINLLAWDEALTNAATQHTLDMSIKNFLNHIGSDGSTPAMRANEAGFTGLYIGENIARGYSSVDDVVEGWKNSPPHCRTIMNFRFQYMGVATNNQYWTLVLGGE
jgi:uncharacterized protein YkwD